jgi:peptide/nickel transport system permease protein
MKMYQYIIRRLLLLIPVLLGVTILIFALTRIGGDPAAAYITPRMTQEQIAQVREIHGFNQPVYIQYLYYMGDLLRGDWGISKAHQDMPVLDVIKLRLPATIELTIVAMTLATVIGIPLGVISATKKDKWPDHATRLFALSGVSIPIFWLGFLMQYVFFFLLKTNGFPYLPLYGRATIYPPDVTGFFIVDSIIAGNGSMLWDVICHLIMPAFCLGYTSLAEIARMTRSSMLEVMGQDYIRTARAKGLSERKVVYKHALRNALIPTVTIIGLSFGALLAGAVLTESIFSWPGVGRWAADSIVRIDTAAIIGFTIIVAIMYTIVNLIVDLMYAYLDPRVRLG